MGSHQHTRAKTFQILLSLWRTEKHLILRKDVLKSRVAATVLIVGGRVCGSRANQAGPSRYTQSLCCLVGSGSGGGAEELFVTSCFPTCLSGFSGGKHPLSKMAMQEFGGRNLSLFFIRMYVVGTFRGHHR